MSAESIRYRVAHPNIVAESFEDEVVVVDLDSGHYFSLEGSGAVCWACAVTGLPETAILDEICAFFDVDKATVDGSVRDFLQQLTAEGLLVATDTEPGNVDPPALPTTKSDDRPEDVARPVFTPPIVNRYSDMRELLLIDPVHMVDDSGWPTTKPAPPADDA